MIHFAFDPRSTRKTLHKTDGAIKAYRYGNFKYVKSDCNRDVWNPTFVYEPTTERKCGVCFKDAPKSELDRLRQIEAAATATRDALAGVSYREMFGFEALNAVLEPVEVQK